MFKLVSTCKLCFLFVIINKNWSPSRKNCFCCCWSSRVRLHSYHCIMCMVFEQLLLNLLSKLLNVIVQFQISWSYVCPFQCTSSSAWFTKPLLAHSWFPLKMADRKFRPRCYRDRFPILLFEPDSLWSVKNLQLTMLNTLQMSFQEMFISFFFF